MTGKQTRRRFLAAAASLTVAGCTQQQGQGTNQTGTMGSTTTGTPHTTSTATATPTATPKPDLPDEYQLAPAPQLGKPDRVANGVETHNLRYALAPERELRLKLHLPEDASGSLPLLVHMHGGGWYFVSHKFDEDRRKQAKQGLAVASIQYRLSGTAKYPAAVRDVVGAMTWLRDRAAGPVGIDPERVALIGESAGAHLAALVGFAPEIENFHPPNVDAHADGVDLVIAISGIYHLYKKAAAHDRSAVSFFGCNGEQCPEKYRQASAGAHVDSNDPPTLLYHGTDDQRIPYRTARIFRDQLEKAGVPVTLITGEGGGHVTPYQQPWGDKMRRKQKEMLTKYLDM
ncbi:MAG: alpha/beta hydrolase fold domain-containing protein [Halorientalis sp.]